MKKRTWIFLIIYTLTVLWSGMAYAQSNPTPPNQQTSGALSLTPPDTDFSVGYLSNIFGNVDGVLTSTSANQLLGAMFGIFNGAVLVLGGIVILYTLFVSTIKTAHEGEVLGKQWSSVWIPLRSVISIALLIPKASGYSFIQIIMMWVVVMGIGAADSVWSTALNYFQRGGILIQQNQPLNKIGGGGALIDGSRNLLRMLTCTQMFQNQLDAYTKKSTTPIQIPNFYQGIQASITSKLSDSKVTIDFPGSGYGNLCGSITWSAPPITTPGVNQQNQQQIQQSRGLAVQSMVTQLYGPAQRIVSNALVDNPASNRYELGHILTTNPIMIWGGGDLQKQTPFLLSGATLSSAATSYFGIMAPTLNLIQNYSKVQELTGKWIDEAKRFGWILAGSYYYQVIKINEGAGSISETAPPTFNVNMLTNIPSNVASYFFPDGANSTYAKNIDSIVNGNASYQVGPASPFSTDAVTYGKSLTYGSIESGTIGGNTPSSGNGRIDNILSIFTSSWGPLFSSFKDLAGAQSTNQNPVFLLAGLGSSLVDMVVWIYLGIAIGMLAIALTLGWLFGFAVVVGFIAVFLPLLALFSPILMALLAAGLVMALYIPLIPFIIFTFGAIGWLIAVIEAIIAAPLVALGIAHPEGQEILGKAEPAVILLVNVFLRPTFMIFGFLIGMLLSYIGIWLVNAGFWGAYANVVNKSYSGSTFIGMFSGFAAIILYTVLVQQVVQKSFTLIYIIPDEVLKWIGGNIKGMGGEAEAERAVSGTAGSAAESGAKFTTGAVEAGGTAVKSGYEAGKGAGGEGGEDANLGLKGGAAPSDGGGKAEQTKTEIGGKKDSSTGGMGQ